MAHQVALDKIGIVHYVGYPRSANAGTLSAAKVYGFTGPANANLFTGSINVTQLGVPFSSGTDMLHEFFLWHEVRHPDSFA